MTQKFLVYLAPKQIANWTRVCALLLFDSLWLQAGIEWESVSPRQGPGGWQWQMGEASTAGLASGVGTGHCDRPGMGSHWHILVTQDTLS